MIKTVRSLAYALLVTTLLSSSAQAGDGNPEATRPVAADVSGGLTATVYGPYGSYRQAKRVADYWKHRGYHAEIYYRHGYYYVKVY